VRQRFGRHIHAALVEDLHVLEVVDVHRAGHRRVAASSMFPL